jgi:outer membrane receptor protein involved in Fe transport
LSYKFKIRNQPVTIQANVSNVLDYEKPVYTSVAIYKNVAYKNNYYYIPPPEVLFSFKTKF